MSDSNLKTTGYPLTFEAVSLMDEIRRENHCAHAMCAYRENCVCWDELLEQMKNAHRRKTPHHQDIQWTPSES